MGGIIYQDVKNYYFMFYLKIMHHKSESSRVKEICFGVQTIEFVVNVSDDCL